MGRAGERTRLRAVVLEFPHSGNRVSFTGLVRLLIVSSYVQGFHHGSVSRRVDESHSLTVVATRHHALKLNQRRDGTIRRTDRGYSRVHRADGILRDLVRKDLASAAQVRAYVVVRAS